MQFHMTESFDRTKANESMILFQRRKKGPIWFDKRFE